MTVVGALTQIKWVCGWLMFAGFKWGSNAAAINVMLAPLLTVERLKYGTP